MPSHGNQRRSGLLTPDDKKWLNGNRSGKDQKLALREGIANTMADIKYLFEQDLEDVNEPSLDGLSELFDNVESKAGMSREECAKYLIALSFLVTNEPIDYAELVDDLDIHPRDESNSELPRDDNRPTKGAPVNFGQPVNDVLTFRNALSDGIKIGKERVEGEQAQVPNTILIDSNTRLYKAATTDRLNPPDSTFPGEKLRDAFAASIDSDGPAEGEKEMGPDRAAEYLANELEISVSAHLTRRRANTEEEIRRHEIP